MNIYDIAREAGVSIATVSRVLNDKGTVSAATRAKVEAALSRTGYVPSAIAQGMAAHSMRTAAILTADVREPAAAQMVYTIEREFSRRGYDVILCNTGGDRETAVRYLQGLAKRRADGIILAGPGLNAIGADREVRRLLEAIPVVAANAAPELPAVRSVLTDDAHGIALAVERLWSQGRRFIYYVGTEDMAGADPKRDGFLQGMRRCGLDGADQIISVPAGLDGGRHAGEKLLAGGPCDGVICGDDLTAVGVVRALTAARLRVPRDVAVTGYGDSPYARLCEPPLTTVDGKTEQAALLSAQLLVNLIEKADAYASVTIQPELVIRETA